MNSKVQLNNNVFEEKRGKVYLNGKEVGNLDAELRAQSLISVGFVAGTLAGGAAGYFLALLFNGYFH